jgi:hypothetical protein
MQRRLATVGRQRGMVLRRSSGRGSDGGGMMPSVISVMVMAQARVLMALMRYRCFVGGRRERSGRIGPARKNREKGEVGHGGSGLVE